MAYKDPSKKKAYMREYLARPGVAERRRECTRLWSAENREHLLRREKHRQLTKRAQCLVAYARKRARDHGHAFSLDAHVADLQARIDLGHCELTGIPFRLEGGKQWNSPSIDRIEPEKGYTIDNVRLILFGLNAALGSWGEDRLVQMVEAMQLCRRSPRTSSKPAKKP